MRLLFLFVISCLQWMTPLNAHAGQQRHNSAHSITTSHVSQAVQDQDLLARLPHGISIQGIGVFRSHYPLQADGNIASFQSFRLPFSTLYQLPAEFYFKPLKLKLVFPEHYFW